MEEIQKYMILANVAFDRTCGEYNPITVENIFLGFIENMNHEDALVYAGLLLEEYCKNENHVVAYESSVKIVIS
jgi:hypothetical protein